MDVPAELTTTSIANFGQIEPTPIARAAPVSYSPDKTRENYRGIIALILIALMAAIIAISFALLWIHPDRNKDLQQFFAVVYGPVVALVGAATGYYFGSQSTK